MAPEQGTSWFYRGKAGIEKAKQINAEQKARREQRGTMRFWLENDSSAKITFLDSPIFFTNEHNLQLGGKFYNFFTCIGDRDSCPPCLSKNTPSWIAVGTIINHRTYRDREGNEYKNQKMLFVAKGRAQDRILYHHTQKDKNGENLRGCVFEAIRGSQTTECATGEQFEYLGRLNDEKLKKLIPSGEDESWLKPFDYEKIFAPKTANELRKILGMEAPVGASSESNGEEGPGPDDFDDAGGKAEDDLSIDDLI